MTNWVRHTHMFCYGFIRTNFMVLCSLCGCPVESYLLVWLVQQVVVLPKVIQDPCPVCRDDVYMVTLIGTM